ncbi:MAG: rRNA adenine dimethyltransferase family protein, partial [bacterium]|nr:rRNA adenine dimethyltransferase family protein [bacterium]
AVEIDPALAEHITETFDETVRVFIGDVRNFSTRELVSFCDGKHFKLIANIPYNITSEVLEKFLVEDPAPSVLVMLVQKEVAERVTAETESLSRLGVFVQYFGRAEIIRKVGRSAFYPSPKVESAVLRIRRNPPEILAKRERIVPRETFFRIVRFGFSSPRRKLLGNLSRGLRIASEKLVPIFQSVNLSLDARADRVSVDTWIALSRAITVSVTSH